MDEQTRENVIALLPASGFNRRRRLACRIEERNDVQRLVGAYMRLVRASRQNLAESFVNLLDEISRSSVRESALTIPCEPVAGRK